MQLIKLFAQAINLKNNKYQILAIDITLETNP